MFGEDVTVITEKQEFSVAVSVDVVASVQALQLLTPLVNEKKKVDAIVPPSFERQASTDGRACYPLSVTHLPPLYLYISYHERYPSAKPPFFDLHAKWLDRKSIPKLREKIEKQFTPGCEFVYDLVEYLRAEFLQLYLLVQANEHDFKLDEECPDGPPQEDSNSGVMFIRSSSVVNDLEEYDKYKKHEIFMSTKHLCDICTDERKGGSFPETQLPCGHLFCRECLAQYCETKLNSGGVGGLHCPMPKCEVDLSLPVLRAVLDEKHFERYERLLAEYICDVTPGVVYCPRPGCRSRVFSDPDDSLAICDCCRYPFCKNCNKLWHGGEACKTNDEVVTDDNLGTIAEKLERLEKNKEGISEHKKQELLADLKTGIWIASNPVKKCPRCTFVVAKDGGCNKMYCIKCRSYFCWICGELIGGYSHFSNSGCPLFREADYHPPQKLQDVNVKIDNPDLLHVLLHPKCPKCDMVCTTSFCYAMLALG
jgi:E3 ubiquitin-protein ligase RNF14